MSWIKRILSRFRPQQKTAPLRDDGIAGHKIAVALNKDPFTIDGDHIPYSDWRTPFKDVVE